MPLDPNIPLQSGKNQQDPLESASRIFMLKSAMQQSKMGDYELQDQLTLRDASGMPDVKNQDGTMNIPALLGHVTGKVSPKTMLTLTDAAQKQEVFKQQQQKAKQDQMQAFVKASADPMASIYTEYKTDAAKVGPEKAWEIAQPKAEALRQELSQTFKGMNLQPMKSPDQLEAAARHSETALKQQMRATQPETPHEARLSSAAERRAAAAESAVAKKPDASKGGMAGWSEEEKDKLAQDAMKDKSILTNIGRGTQGRQDILDITRRMTRLMLADKSSTAEQRAEFRADTNSLVQLTKKSDAIESTLKSFHNNLNTWDSLAKGELPKLGGERVAAMEGQLKKIDFTGVQSLDDWKLKIKQQVNDPTVNAYLVASMTAAMDYARIMSSQGQSAGQITEGARNEAIRLVRAGANDKARAGIMAAMESDTEGQRKGITDQRQQVIDRMTKGKGSSTDKKPEGEKKRRPLSDFGMSGTRG